MNMNNIIALGAENKTSFSVISEKGLFVSSSNEDLKNVECFQKFEEEVRSRVRSFGSSPYIIACDMHSDYRSTYLAETLAKENHRSSLIRVQHHFAHIASCMFDNDIDEAVTGVSFDGAGYGDDAAIWGGEFLVATRKSYERPYHLKYVPQPGGDAASREGWRMAVSYLYNAYGDKMTDLKVPLFERIGKKKVSLVREMIDKNINSPLTSSMGRLFDAAASLIGIRDVSAFEAEGAILLEKNALQCIEDYYGYEIGADYVDVSPMIRGMVEDDGKGVDKGKMSAKFHNTIVEIIFNVSERIYKEHGTDKVFISGGCFQNKYLVDHLEKRFSGTKLKLFKHEKYSPTDMGISVGQLTVAASST